MAGQATEQEKMRAPQPPSPAETAGDIKGLPAVDDETRRALTSASPSIDWKTVKIKTPGVVEVRDGKHRIEIVNNNAAMQAECKEEKPTPGAFNACASTADQVIVMPTVGLLRQYLKPDRELEMILKVTPHSDLSVLAETNPEAALGAAYTHENTHLQIRSEFAARRAAMSYLSSEISQTVSDEDILGGILLKYSLKEYGSAVYEMASGDFQKLADWGPGGKSVQAFTS